MSNTAITQWIHPNSVFHAMLSDKWIKHRQWRSIESLGWGPHHHHRLLGREKAAGLGRGDGEGKWERRDILGGRMRKEKKKSTRVSFFPFLPLVCGMKKQWLFWGTVQTRQLWKLMAVINDNRLEESRDTAATYIMPSRQSLLLPAPLPPTSKTL